MIETFRAIAAALRDVVFGRLTFLALLNLAIAVALTVLAAGAAIRWLVPLIPDGAGWMANLSAAGEFIAGMAVVVVAIALSPAISMLVGGALFDVAAARVEKAIGAPPTRAVPLHEGVLNGARLALPALGLNLIAIPFYFIPVVNAFVFYGLNGFLMGREYATAVAARRMSFTDARALRKSAGVSVFLVGLACSAIPFVAPLVAASAMTRLVAGLVATRSNSPHPDGGRGVA